MPNRRMNLSWVGLLGFLGLLGLFTENKGWFGFFGFFGWFSLNRIKVDERYQQSLARAAVLSYLLTTAGLAASFAVVALGGEARFAMQVVAATFVVHIFSLVGALHYYDWKGN